MVYGMGAYQFSQLLDKNPDEMKEKLEALLEICKSAGIAVTEMRLEPIADEPKAEKLVN